MMAVRLFSTNRMDCSVTDITVKARRLIAQNTRWRIYYDHLTDGSGNDVPDYLVVESCTLRADGVTGIAVLPILNGKLVLLRAYRRALCTELWEAPRGFLEPGETATAAAMRELTEETGLSCSPENLVMLGSYAPEPSTLAARCQLFAALGCKGIPHAPNDELGLSAPTVIDRSEMAALIAAGTVEEAGTLILYYRFCDLQRNGSL